jgi:hypothetical protein
MMHDVVHDVGTYITPHIAPHVTLNMVKKGVREALVLGPWTLECLENCAEKHKTRGVKTRVHECTATGT